MARVGAGAGSYRVEVSQVREETPSVKTFRLSLPEGPPFSFLPGQFVMLAFLDSPKTSRAYSLASSPLEKGYFEVTLNPVGEFSARLWALHRGEALWARGPYGKWVFQDDAAHAVLISGGTGISPVRCMCRYVVQKALPVRVTVLYSSRTPSDIIFRDELAEFSRRPNMKVVTTITRPQLMKPGESWNGPVGRLDIDAIRREVADFERATYYMCGPNQLIDSVGTALAAAGIPRERLRHEKWGEF